MIQCGTRFVISITTKNVIKTLVKTLFLIESKIE